MFPHRIIGDEHFSHTSARKLRALGHDVTSAVALRFDPDVSLSDVQILEAAVDSTSIVVTNDSDFLSLHNAGEPHAGIIRFVNPARIGYENLAKMIHDLIKDQRHLTRRAFIIRPEGTFERTNP